MGGRALYFYDCQYYVEFFNSYFLNFVPFRPLMEQ